MIQKYLSRPFTCYICNLWGSECQTYNSRNVTRDRLTADQVKKCLREMIGFIVSFPPGACCLIILENCVPAQWLHVCLSKCQSQMVMAQEMSNVID